MKISDVVSCDMMYTLLVKITVCREHMYKNNKVSVNTKRDTRTQIHAIIFSCIGRRIILECVCVCITMIRTHTHKRERERATHTTNIGIEIYLHMFVVSYKNTCLHIE
jgi:hypothetical protein